MTPIWPWHRDTLGISPEGWGFVALVLIYGAVAVWLWRQAHRPTARQD